MLSVVSSYYCILLYSFFKKKEKGADIRPLFPYKILIPVVAVLRFINIGVENIEVRTETEMGRKFPLPLVLQEVSHE